MRTLISIALVSGFASLHPLMLPSPGVNPVYATLVGNLLVGMGMLMVFRHRSSLGGLNTLALIVQDRTGWRAGYVQLVFDVAIIAAALFVVPPAQRAAVGGRRGGAEHRAGPQPPARTLPRPLT